MPADNNSGGWITAVWIAGASFATALITQYWPWRAKRREDRSAREEQRREGLEEIASENLKLVIEEYRGQVASLWSEIRALRQENISIRQENDELRAQLAAIKARLGLEK